jgi:hypothetical protein
MSRRGRSKAMDVLTLEWVVGTSAWHDCYSLASLFSYLSPIVPIDPEMTSFVSNHPVYLRMCPDYEFVARGQSAAAH